MAELDLRGLVCPYPTSRTAEALARLVPGETLKIVSDYPPARSTIPWVAEDAGHPWELEDLDKQTFIIRITKAG
jgi:tRNA 2-thiouridine synthesizing protein A